MNCEAKMAAHGGQFCMSVLVPDEVLYVSFSLPRDFLHRKIFLQKLEICPRISNIFRQSQTELQVMHIFTKINYQTNEKLGKMDSKNHFRKLLNACPLLPVTLPSSDNLVQFLDHMVIMNPFKYLIM